MADNFLEAINTGRINPAAMVMQGHKTIDPADVSYTAAVWNVVDRGGAAAIAVGVRVSAASAGGNLQVHLVGNPAGEYETYALAAGTTEGFLFDQIIETATTITLTDLKIYVVNTGE